LLCLVIVIGLSSSVGAEPLEKKATVEHSDIATDYQVVVVDDFYIQIYFSEANYIGGMAQVVPTL